MPKARATWLPTPLHSYHGPQGGRDQAQHRAVGRSVSGWVTGEPQAPLSPRGSPLLSLHGLLVGEQPYSVLRLRQVWGKTHQLRGSCCSGETGPAEGELAGPGTRRGGSISQGTRSHPNPMAQALPASLPIWPRAPSQLGLAPGGEGQLGGGPRCCSQRAATRVPRWLQVAASRSPSHNRFNSGSPGANGRAEQALRMWEELLGAC